MKKIYIPILFSYFFMTSISPAFAKEIIVRPAPGGNNESVVVEIISPESVSGTDELEVFAKDLISQDSNIKLIKLSSGSSEIRYEYPGKLFGVIPIRAWTSAFIGNDNRVKIKFPWHHIFIKRTVDLSLNEKEADLSKFQLENFQGEFQKQAWALQLLSNILKTKAMNGVVNKE